MNGEWMSIRSSMHRQASMNVLDLLHADTAPCSRRMRLPWLAISSIILRLVWLNQTLFLKKSQWP